MPPPHPAEFRRRAIELARARTKPMSEVAKDLRISESCLRNWVAQADVDERGSQTRLTNAEKVELVELRDKRRLELEVGRFSNGRRRISPGKMFFQLIYPLVRELADDDKDVAVACRVSAVSRSGYYDWLGRPASLRAQEEEYLLKLIEQVHADSRETYGSPRVHAELRLGLGLSVSLKRVVRLMRAAGIQGFYRRRHRGCTVRDPAAAPSSDLVNRNFTVTEPNRLWVTDITEHPTREGTLYCAAVMDAYSRLVHCRAHAHRTGHRRTWYGHHSPPTR
ncbi:MAG TPA: IS3 family transposase [Pseudonocardiaceae bacterium]|nr:IS3 family transposase [Pseudonocardiaceae bacterium]